MSYRRYLTNTDYHSLISTEHFNQLVRDIPERITQAEQRAEMQILEYLDQYYDIEKVLATGKNIREYNNLISYPAQTYIRIDETIYKTLTRINGLKRPDFKVYWERIVDFVDPQKIETALPYSQLKTYAIGEVIKFGGEYWQCSHANGFDLKNIQIPGDTTWKAVDIREWEPNCQWSKNEVCHYEKNFYQYLLSEEEAEGLENHGVLSPEEDDAWGMIGDYSETYKYNYSEGAYDYVVCDGYVFYPVMNPNPDALEEGVNIMKDDPRNMSIITHMSRIAIYHLHALISPTNISETRRWGYEDSISWLYNASKFKINPQLPRKKDNESGESKVDWACATYQRDYNPYENAWLI